MKRTQILAFAVMLGLVMAVFSAAPALAQQTALEVKPASAIAGPAVPKARKGPCVRDSKFMRRNHMNILKHQRVETMYKAERGKPEGLKECISCHAVEINDAKLGKFAPIEHPKHFCRVCHDYAAVRVDCFQCHASTPDPKKGAAANEAGKKNDVAALSKYLKEASK
ncbi:MAG: hypothetical protein P8Y47_00120 [Alphaproteobacteria bacterium]